jgi:peroxiredoxin
VLTQDESDLFNQVHSEMDSLARYRDRGVVFVGVAYLDTVKELKAFLEEFNITYPNGSDVGTKIAPNYRIVACRKPSSSVKTAR